MNQNSNLRSDWLVIVNPNAGSGKGAKDWKEIENLLEKYGIPYRPVFTCNRHNAILITRRGVEDGYRKIIAVGGDGTMNEVVNGCFRQKACPTIDLKIAMITVGTGNDWGRMFEIPLNYEKAIQLIAANKTVAQDTGEVFYYEGTRRLKRFFINIAGLGFDAIVCRNTNIQKDKGKSGKAIYFWTLLKSLLGYSYTSTEIDIDGKVLRNEVFTMSLGIGRYSGGGMLQTPHAVIDDGLFDITVIKRMRKGEVIRSLKKLYDGTILEHPKIEGFKGKVIAIDSDPLIHLEADGESLGHSPIEFRIIPQSINVIIP
ncbi:MAG: diacylglycerol kinase family lipid kinase [Bacteroidales bacterium]|nr:diacylglycerol kinase family lipid kinase [Bacteroidales bacterium]